jgi:hypothetical protein
MTPRTAALAVILLLTMSGASWAQTSQSAPPASAAQQNDGPVNVDRLPLDLVRVERRLRQSTERENWDGFRLRYTVEVFGAAPRLQFFEPKDVLPSGPIPYGAPTHKEMVDQMTPREFRQQPMDFSALMRWLQEKMK